MDRDIILLFFGGAISLVSVVVTSLINNWHELRTLRIKQYEETRSRVLVEFADQAGALLGGVIDQDYSAKDFMRLYEQAYLFVSPYTQKKLDMLLKPAMEILNQKNNALISPDMTELMNQSKMVRKALVIELNHRGRKLRRKLHKQGA